MSASDCGCNRYRAALISVTTLLVIAVVGWVREANKEPRIVEVAQQAEVVEVLVASRNLTTGTAFTKGNLDQLTRFAHVTKSSVPPDAKIIKNKEELIGKRLARTTQAGEHFNVADVNSKTILLFEPVKDIISLPFAATIGGGYIGPGSRVDIMCSYIKGTKRAAFKLVSDLDVVAVNEGQFPDTSVVSVAVEEQQAKVIVLANHLNCHMELLARHPDSPRREFDYEKTFTLLQALKKQQDETPLEVAPEPRVKAEP